MNECCRGNVGFHLKKKKSSCLAAVLDKIATPFIESNIELCPFARLDFQNSAVQG